MSHTTPRIRCFVAWPQSTMIRTTVVPVVALLLILLTPWYGAAWSPPSVERRKLLGSAGIVVGIVCGGGGCCSSSSSSVAMAADSRLFRPNPLVNPFLEQFRIWDQEYADNIKYGGELERGDAGNKGQVEAYPRLLVPILIMSNDLYQVQQAIKDRSTIPLAIAILQQPKFGKTEFKRMFNAFADNIYFSDPDRANLYLAGGATPRSEQSLAYLLRNDILTNVEDLLAELIFLESSKDSSSSTSSDVMAEAQRLADAATSAMQQYLSIVPPNELEQARRYVLDLS